MGFTKSYFMSLLLYVSVINEIRLPTVTCQDEEGTQCLPKKTFVALLRLPEVSSNLAAYSRTARISEDTKSRNDIVHLKALTATDDGDDAEICIPGGVYLELFRDPAMRGHLAAIGRSQKVLDYLPGRIFDETDESDSKDLPPETEKRSIATLAKNDDLPISFQGRDEEDDEDEKRSVAPRYESLDAFLRSIMEESRRSLPGILRDYSFPNGEIGKRNVGTLARDYALPQLGRRNVASVARDYGLPNGKRNIGSLAREYMLPVYGKRNVASLARVYMLPQTGKRNVAALARDYGLPYGKRYLGSLARISGLPSRAEYSDDKRSVASLARNSAGVGRFVKRPSPPGVFVLRTLSRHGRSLNDRQQAVFKDDPLDLQMLAAEVSAASGRDSGKLKEDVATGTTPSFAVHETSVDSEAKNRSNRRMNQEERRSKRQIEFSDEYPLPVMQNGNVLDYEEMIEALTGGQYPNPEKRFMGRIPQMGPRPTTPPTRRLGR